jgi:CotS family spore coat protein
MVSSLDELITCTGEQHLPDYLGHFFDLKLLGGKPIRGVLQITTDEGIFVLKRVRNDEKDRWKLIYELGEHLNVKGLSFPTPIVTTAQKPFFDGYHYTYVLLPWIEAEDISFQSLEDWQIVSQGLAVYHQKTRDFVPSRIYRKYYYGGKWFSTFKQAHRQLELYHLAAKWTRVPSQVDTYWLEYTTYTRGLIENLLEYYEKIGGDQQCKDFFAKSKVCHNNLHRHNVKWESSKRQAMFIDWNDLVLDVRARDLAKWLLYAFGRTGSPVVLASVLQAYQEIEPLDEKEYELIYTQLLFPDQLFTVLKSIYSDQTLSLSDAAPALRSAIKREEEKLLLLKRFEELVKEQFGVKILPIAWINQR